MCSLEWQIRQLYVKVVLLLQMILIPRMAAAPRPSQALKHQVLLHLSNDWYSTS